MIIIRQREFLKCTGAMGLAWVFGCSSSSSKDGGDPDFDGDAESDAGDTSPNPDGAGDAQGDNGSGDTRDTDDAGGDPADVILSSFQIDDGDPDPLVSDSIWCKKLVDTPPGWQATDALPPGVYEDPVYRDGHWVWLKVRQIEALDVAQVAHLRLFAGIEGRTYSIGEILDPSNHFAPDVTWQVSDWEAQLALGKVVPIPWFDGVSSQPTCEISLPANQPGLGAERWYQFKWERNLIQPPYFCTSSNVALIAVVDDSKATSSNVSVVESAAAARRNAVIL